MASDSEEEMFDRGRQHSVLPHPAAEAPFCSTILTKEPQSECPLGEKPHMGTGHCPADPQHLVFAQDR